MKDYKKPLIEEETIELEDIIAVSGGTKSGDVDKDGESIDVGSLW